MRLSITNGISAFIFHQKVKDQEYTRGDFSTDARMNLNPSGRGDTLLSGFLQDEILLVENRLRLISGILDFAKIEAGKLDRMIPMHSTGFVKHIDMRYGKRVGLKV